MIKKFASFKAFGLSIVLLLMFGVSVTGQFLTGFRVHNQELVKWGGQPETSLMRYARSGHFVSSLAENMESEFLQMSLYIYLTVFLYQRGSADSKKMPDEENAADLDEDRREHAYSQQKLARHPWLWRLYENSFALALASLFAGFFCLHAYGSLRTLNQENALTGKPLLTTWEIFGEPEFWFESFQNWQSEFFSIAAVGLLGIVLRQKGSPQSKRMNDPHAKTKG